MPPVLDENARQKVNLFRCAEDGYWFLKINETRVWTNYTACDQNEESILRVTIDYLYKIGYIIGIIALLFTLFIFIYMKTLRDIPFRISMNILSAFVLDNIVWMLWDKTATNNTDTSMENMKYCQTLHAVSKYTTTSIYGWMLIENLYLQLSSLFVHDSIAKHWMHAFAFGGSIMFSLIIGDGLYNSENTTRCWIDTTEVYWIVTIPIILSLLMSLYFLVHVVCILVIKLHPTTNHRIVVTTKKATRAALILIPLLMPFRPSPENAAEKYYQVLSCILTSLCKEWAFLNSAFVPNFKYSLAIKECSKAQPLLISSRTVQNL